MNKAQTIRDYIKANPEAKAKAIAEALGMKLQYVYTVKHKASSKTKRQFKHNPMPKVAPISAEERQLAKGQQILRDEISNLHRQITRLKLHNDMLQSMLKVQEFDLMHGHGAPV